LLGMVNALPPAFGHSDYNQFESSTAPLNRA
jgi:hypothetical protein